MNLFTYDMPVCLKKLPEPEHPWYSHSHQDVIYRDLC